MKPFKKPISKDRKERCVTKVNNDKVKWDITYNGNEVMISDTVIKIKEICGGFDQGQKILTVQQIALLHVDDSQNKKKVTAKVKRINELINNNIVNFTYMVDILDLKNHNNNLDKLKEAKIYTQAQIGNAKSIYILSSTGYCKLYNIREHFDIRLEY